MTDSAVLIAHAFTLLAHGGVMGEDCELCSELMTVGKAMEAYLQNVPQAREPERSPSPT